MEVKPYPGREEAKMLAKRLSERPQGFSLRRSKKGLLQLAALQPLAKRSGEGQPARLADSQLSRCKPMKIDDGGREVRGWKKLVQEN